jgi:hypothetical protein
LTSISSPRGAGFEHRLLRRRGSRIPALDSLSARSRIAAMVASRRGVRELLASGAHEAGIAFTCLRRARVSDLLLGDAAHQP